MTYTYDDVLTAKDIRTGRVKEEDIIGKKGIFIDCFPDDMSRDTLLKTGYEGKLIRFTRNRMFPFWGDNDTKWSYFIPNKEESAPGLRFKFKVGNRVKHDRGIATVVNVDKGDPGLTYRIRFEDDRLLWVRESDISPAEDKPAYTEADIIDSPDDPRLKGAIGKECYFSDISEIVLENALEDKGTGVLTDVDAYRTHPFYVDGRMHWGCIIIKKGQNRTEPAPKSYEERQAEWVKANNIKARDKVRILRGFEPYENGFKMSMNDEHKMDGLIGTIGEVREISPSDIGVWSVKDGRSWYWPYFVLEKMEYIPFNLSEPEDRDALRGMWIKDRRWGNEWLISGFYVDETGGQGWKAKLTRKNTGFTGSELMERFTFLDGSVIGKIANSQQMAGK